MTEKEINKIVSENLNYVKSVANQYKGKGVEFDDLVSEGTLAMLMAARKFQADRGTDFVAYAGPFVHKAISQAIDKQSRSLSFTERPEEICPKKRRQGCICRCATKRKQSVYPIRHIKRSGCKDCR